MGQNFGNIGNTIKENVLSKQNALSKRKKRRTLAIGLALLLAVAMSSCDLALIGDELFQTPPQSSQNSTTQNPPVQSPTLPSYPSTSLYAPPTSPNNAPTHPDQPRNEPGIKVSFMDVGQGDAILIQATTGAMLVDGGPVGSRDAVVYYIAGYGITFIDYIVATHPHADHIGGLSEVTRAFEVGAVVMPNVTHTTRTFERFMEAIEYANLKIIFAEAGMVFMLDCVVITVVAPNGSGYSNLNDYSIVLHVAYGNSAFLLTGDAEAVSEREILGVGWDIASQVLGVGHHGSRTSTTEAFLAAVNPTYAVIQVGANNQYGHPHGVVVERLEGAGVTVLRNDRHGTVRFASDGDAVWLKP